MQTLDLYFTTTLSIINKVRLTELKRFVNHTDIRIHSPTLPKHNGVNNEVMYRRVQCILKSMKREPRCTVPYGI